MENLTNVVIVVSIVAVVFGLRWVVSATLGRYAETHAWLGVAAAFGLIIWSVLIATGVDHEPPYRVVKTYIGGALGATLLIALGLSKRSKTR